MLHPLRTLLDAVTPWLPPVLVSAPWRQRIHELASRLPAAFDWALIECRLAPDEPQVDFSVCASVQDGGRERLATLSPDEAALARLDAPQRFAREWVQEESSFRDMPFIWIEYDLPRDGGSRVPSTFLCTEPSFPELGSPGMPPARLRQWLARGLPLLGREIEPAILDTVERCARCLPERGRILHVSSMVERGTRGLRTCAMLPGESLAGWLQAIGWPGDPSRVERAFDVCGSPAFTGLDVEVSETVEPYFAIELPVPSHVEACRATVERFVRHGLADPAKAEAVVQWLGDETVELPGSDWLVNVQRQLYFKVVPHRDGRLEAKVYLALHPRFVLF